MIPAGSGRAMPSMVSYSYSTIRMDCEGEKKTLNMPQPHLIMTPI